MDKILTISIAAYNAEKCIHKALDSLINLDPELKTQLEIIIVNDGSKDQTYEVALSYQCNEPDMIKIINKKNGGYGSTINVALDAATGKYFKLLDADDWYDTEELGKLIKYLKHANSDLIITDYDECGNNRIVRHEIESVSPGIVNISDIKCNIVMHECCYKTSLLRESALKLQEHCLYTDVEFVTYPLIYVNSIEYVKYHVYQYFIGNEGQSVSLQSRINHYGDAINVVKRMLKYYKLNNVEEMKIPIIEHNIASSYQFALASLMMGDIRRMFELIKFDNYIKKNFARIYNTDIGRSLRTFRLNRFLMYIPFRYWLRKSCNIKI